MAVRTAAARQPNQRLAALIHEGPVFAVAWKILQWPIALGFVFITFALIYHFAPDLAAKRRQRRLSSRLGPPGRPRHPLPLRPLRARPAQT